MSGLQQEIVAEWLRVMCAHEQGSHDQPRDRLRSLRWGVDQISLSENPSHGGNQIVSVSGEGTQQAARRRTLEFLQIASVARLPIIVVDGAATLSRSPEACLRVADQLATFARELRRGLVVLALNEDEWQAGFNGLPSALEDRLTGIAIDLKALDCDEGQLLVQHRLGEEGVSQATTERYLQELRADWSDPMPTRAVLRWASAKWRRGQREGDKIAESGALQEEASAAKPMSNQLPSLFPQGEPKLAPRPVRRPFATHSPVSASASEGNEVADDRIRAAFLAKLEDESLSSS